MIDWNAYPNFERWEFACHCGTCDRADMDKAFLDELQAMRTKLGFPFHINSGFRCPAHNARVSNTGLEGPHTTGKAVDIALHTGQAMLLLEELVQRRIKRIGLQQKGPLVNRFIHFDQSEDHPSPALWTY